MWKLEPLATVVVLTFLSLCQPPTNASFSAGVKYSGPAAGTDDSAATHFDRQASDDLLPFDPALPSSEDDIQLDHFMPFPHYLPKRAKRQAPLPINTTVVDNHDYYTSKFYGPGDIANHLWIDLTNVTGVIEDLAHNISDRYRFFAVHDLMFDFPFYGHIINSVAITTAGFIYVGTFLHPFIHLTQYIAPLQADFNPSLNETATVLVHGTEDRFTIQWDKVHNHDHVANGTFTFQLTLFKSGEIHFVYREVPLLVSEISDENHPVVVGLADSFYVDTQVEGSGGPGILRTIYEYHRIGLNASDSLANSAYVLKPLPNCIMASSCEECVSVSADSPFECGWCDRLNRCSDGIDRHRQEWFQSFCALTNTQQCEAPTTATTAAETTTTTTTATTAAETTTAETTTAETTTAETATTAAETTTAETTTTEATTASAIVPDTPPPVVNPGQSGSEHSTGTITGIVVIVVIVVILLLIIIGVVTAVLVYGYRNPTSTLGQAMIKYRPKARSLNKVSATYNVETGKTKLTDNY